MNRWARSVTDSGDLKFGNQVSATPIKLLRKVWLATYCYLHTGIATPHTLRWAQGQLFPSFFSKSRDLNLEKISFQDECIDPY